MVFFFQAEDGIRDLVRSRGLGDVYKRQLVTIFIQFVVVGSSASQMRPIRHGSTLNLSVTLNNASEKHDT